MKHLDKCARIEAAAQSGGAFVEVRGADGRLYGRIDLQQLLFEVKKGRQAEIIDLKALLHPKP